MNTGEKLGGKYRLVRQLGAGAMGVVWEAVNEMTSGRLAIKLLSKPSDDLRHRLLREARICGSIKHRNVIEIYDVGETEGGDPYLVMQLLSGETLSDLLRQKRRLELPLVAQIGRDIARALAAAHEKNVVHRDLKPANVFLHQEPGVDGLIVKVLDFGVAKNLSVHDSMMTAPGSSIGSPAYMSPEAIRANAPLDARTDIWSLGVVLFEMLTGTRPFTGGGQELFVRILTGKVPRLSDSLRHIAADVDTLVARCLERDRDKRLASAAAIAQELDVFVDPEEGSRVHVGLAEQALGGMAASFDIAAPILPIAQHMGGLRIREAPASAPMPRQPEAPAPAERPVAQGAALRPWMQSNAVDATAPLPPPAKPKPHVGKHGTMIMGKDAPASSGQGIATGPKGTALMIDSKAVLAQAPRPLPAPPPPRWANTGGNAKTLASAGWPEMARATPKRAPVVPLLIGALVIGAFAFAVVMGLTRTPSVVQPSGAPAEMRTGIGQK